MLPDRRGLGRSCLVRRGRGSLLTEEEVGGEPPPLAFPPGLTCDQPCGPAVASWPPPLAAFAFAAGAAGRASSPPRLHWGGRWGGSSGAALGCGASEWVRCCPSEKMLLMVPGTLLNLEGAVELFQEHDPGQMMSSMRYAPCGAG